MPLLESKIKTTIGRDRKEFAVGAGRVPYKVEESREQQLAEVFIHYLKSTKLTLNEYLIKYNTDEQFKKAESHKFEDKSKITPLDVKAEDILTAREIKETIAALIQLEYQQANKKLSPINWKIFVAAMKAHPNFKDVESKLMAFSFDKMHKSMGKSKKYKDDGFNTNIRDAAEKLDKENFLGLFPAIQFMTEDKGGKSEPSSHLVLKRSIFQGLGYAMDKRTAAVNFTDKSLNGKVNLAQKLKDPEFVENMIAINHILNKHAQRGFFSNLFRCISAIFTFNFDRFKKSYSLTDTWKNAAREIDTMLSKKTDKVISFNFDLQVHETHKQGIECDLETKHVNVINEARAAQNNKLNRNYVVV